MGWYLIPFVIILLLRTLIYNTRKYHYATIILWYYHIIVLPTFPGLLKCKNRESPLLQTGKSWVIILAIIADLLQSNSFDYPLRFCMPLPFT